MLHYWDDQSLANVVVLISHTDWLWALWEQQRFTLWVSDSLTSVKHPKPQQTTQPNGNDRWLVRLSRSVKGYHSANLQPITDPPAHCPRPKAPIQWHILYFLAGQGLSFLFLKVENQESLNFFSYILHVTLTFSPLSPLGPRGPCSPGGPWVNRRWWNNFRHNLKTCVLNNSWSLLTLLLLYQISFHFQSLLCQLNVKPI